MSETLNGLEAEIQEMASERTADILPLLYDRLMEREGLEKCPRHSMLADRVKAEVRLHHAKKALRDGPYLSSPGCTLNISAAFEAAFKHAERVRKLYRSKPCTCWIEHR